MPPKRNRLTAEMLFGTLYGVGLSLLVWFPIGGSGWSDPNCVLMVCLTVGCAALARGTRWFRATYPATLIMQLLFGLAPAVVTAATATLLTGWIRNARRVDGSRRVAEISRATISASCAGIVATWIPEAIPRAVLHGAVFACVDASLAYLVAAIEPKRCRLAPRSIVLTWTATLALGLPAAAAVISLQGIPDVRPWLLTIPLAIVTFRVGRSVIPRSVTDRARASLRDEARRRALTRAVHLAVCGLDAERGDRQRRIADGCEAIGEALGLTLNETRALRAASLTHEAGLLALPPRQTGAQVAVHPTLSSDIVQAIGHPYPVTDILRHARDSHDRSSFALASADDEDVPLLARIFTTVRDFERAADELGDRNLALSRIAAQSGSRYDPLLVELLADLVMGFDEGEQEQTRASLLESESRLTAEQRIESALQGRVGNDGRFELAARRLAREIRFESLILFRRAEGDEFEPVFGYVHDGVFDATWNSMRLRLPRGRVERTRIVSLGFNAWVSGDHDRIHENAPTIVAPVGEDGDAALLVANGAPGDRFESRHADLMARVASVMHDLVFSQAEEIRLTDGDSGLPNARYLRAAIERRCPGRGHVAPAFGVIAVRLESSRWPVIAKRAAEALVAGEVVGRLGTRELLVVTPVSRPDQLAERCEALRGRLDTDATDDVRTVHATYPVDGDGVDDLLVSLGDRLALTRRGRLTILPFRASAQGA